jgi:HEAT repeat protein
MKQEGLEIRGDSMFYICPRCFKLAKYGEKKCKYCGFDFKEISSEEYSSKLIKALEHPDHNVAVVASNIIAKLGIKSEEKLIKRLIELLQEKKDPYLESDIIKALGEVGSKKAYAFLIKNKGNFSVISEREIEKAINKIKSKMDRNN